MKKWSFDDWCIKVLEKYRKQFTIIFKLIVFIVIIAFLRFFIQLGFHVGTRTMDYISRAIIKGIIGTVVLLIAFISFHFYEGTEFDLRCVGLPLGLAIGYVVIGIFGGFYKSIFAWVCGAIISAPVIWVTSDIIIKSPHNKGINAERATRVIRENSGGSPIFYRTQLCLIRYVSIIFKKYNYEKFFKLDINKYYSTLITIHTKGFY